jgi:prefoldin subunit 5
VKELNKTIQDLKMKIETLKKTQRETTQEMDNLGKRSGVTDAHHQQNTRDRGENLRHRRYHRKH